MSFLRLCLNQGLGTAKAELHDWLETVRLVNDPLPDDVNLIENLLEVSSDETVGDFTNRPEEHTAKVVAKLDGIIDILHEIRSTVVGNDSNPTTLPASNSAPAE